MMKQEKDPAFDSSNQETRDYSFIRAFKQVPTGTLGIGKVRFAIALTIRLAQILIHPDKDFQQKN